MVRIILQAPENYNHGVNFRTLISTDALATGLGRPDLTIVDCRFRLDDVDWGERQWSMEHVPGAVYAHLDRDLSGPRTGSNGRHPLPDPAALAHTFGQLGIGSGAQVVAYDQDSGMFASRLWWLLRWLGHDRVAVLDGGFARWCLEGRATTSRAEQPRPREFRGIVRDDMVVGASEVAQHLGDPSWRLVDSRAPERYRGEVEPIDPVAGHIPTAINHFFRLNLGEDGRFRERDDLRVRVGPLLEGVEPAHVVFYCGSGVQACHNVLALEHAGIAGAKLYPGSWSEWSSDPDRPVATRS
jgi:thiosulfate/3-mercaptopyruvate sulfurtransferase